MLKNQLAETELEIISKLECPNIVKYFDHFEMVKKEYDCYETYICLVTEFCDVSYPRINS